MGTGSRSSDLENYCDFKSRDPENFSRYNNQFRAILTWIYMKDKEVDRALSDL